MFIFFLLLDFQVYAVIYENNAIVCCVYKIMLYKNVYNGTLIEIPIHQVKFCHVKKHLFRF